VSLSAESHTFIVRNFNMENSFPLSPRRSCQKNTGPAEVQRIAIMIIANAGDVISSTAVENTMSNARFKRL
jgi:hypothetical protein